VGRKELSAHDKAKPSTKFELTTLENYSDENLLAELRRIAAELNGKRLTIEKFNELSRVHYTTLRNRFGSWKNALDLAGISETIAPRFIPLTREAVIANLRAYAAEFPGTPVTQEEIARRLGVDKGSITRKFGKWPGLLNEVGISSVPLGRRYTDEECYENIVALWTHYGRQPSFTELKRPPSTVGSKAYVLRWGGWRAALGAFIKYVNQEPQTVQETVSNKSSTEISASSPITTPRSISLSLRYKVLSRDRFRCVICGRSPAKDPSIELHVDHIEPWSKGGPNTEENLRTLCFDCNLGKGAKIES
jgi:Homing endonuclease associated repeat/HNH endonuclease